MEKDSLQIMALLGATMIGAGSSILGGFLSTRWNHKYTEAREAAKDRAARASSEREIRRQHLLKVVELVIETEDWLEQYGQSIATLGIYAARGQSAPDQQEKFSNRLDEATSLQVVFFPELEAEMVALSAAKHNHSKFVEHHINLINQNAQKWLNDCRATFGTEHGKMLGDFLLSRKMLVKKAREIVQATFLPHAP